MNSILVELPALLLISTSSEQSIRRSACITTDPTSSKENTRGITCITTHRTYSEQNTRGITYVTTNLTNYEPAEGYTITSI
jgi:hypothetical protein